MYVTNNAMFIDVLSSEFSWPSMSLDHKINKRIIKMYHRFRYIFNPRKMCSHLIYDSDNIPPQWLVVLVLIRVVRSPESGNSLKTFIIHANCICLGILLILTVNDYDFSPSFKFHPN